MQTVISCQAALLIEASSAHVRTQRNSPKYKSVLDIHEEALFSIPHHFLSSLIPLLLFFLPVGCAVGIW